MTGPRAFSRRNVLLATVTPLASILGSGLLIIVPVLEVTLGSWSLFGVVGVSAVAWWVGTAVRHNVRVVEPLAVAGHRDPVTRRIDVTGDAVIVVAYVISVALYLRIMSEYIVGFVNPSGSPIAERVIACVAVAVIVAIGVLRGFTGLDLLDRVTIIAVLVLTTVLGVTLFVHDVASLAGPGLRLPPAAGVGAGDGLGPTLLVLSGIVITVQGFETVRYLGSEFDIETRVWASRIAQLIAASIYVGFVIVTTPVMGLGTPAGPDRTLLDITDRVAPLLALPLVLSAAMSQFSAAIADTAAAEGNLRSLSRWMRGARPYLLSGIVAIALAATVSTLSIIAIASRAFAAYYALQALLALRTSTSVAAKVGYGVLVLAMTAVTLLAEPVG